MILNSFIFRYLQYSLLRLAKFHIWEFFPCQIKSRKKIKAYLERCPQTRSLTMTAVKRRRMSGHYFYLSGRPLPGLDRPLHVPRPLGGCLRPREI